MSLFKTYPPSELTLDLLCSMSPRDVLKYIKDMNEAQKLRVKSLKECLKDFSLENIGLSQENIGLKDDRKAMAHIMEERAESSAQTVRDLTEVIEGLREEVAVLEHDAKEDKKLMSLALDVCNGIDQGGCQLDDDTKDAYDALWAYRDELYGSKEEISEEEAPKQESVTPAQAWENFTFQTHSIRDAIYSLAVGMVTSQAKIKYNGWVVRDDEGNRVDGKMGKPSKEMVQKHYSNGIAIQFDLQDKDEEFCVDTTFDGTDWIVESIS